jgi:putative ABC transport system permease protein
MDHIHTIYIQGRDEDALAGISSAARELLRERHRLRKDEDDDFTVQNQAVILETAIAMATSTQKLVIGVAAASLLVAGIGILAMMLMTVRERRWEIGLRRALGARSLDVLLQFLAEAVLLASLGGGSGILISWLAVEASNRMDWGRAIFSTPTALLAGGLSLGVGVVFGLYPAWKASRMEPVEALRSAV